MKKKNIELKELLIVALASILFAAGYNMFIEPAGIILGGVTGIAAVLNRLFPKIPVGSYILLLNFPLLLLCLRTFGFRFILRSLVGTLLSGVFLDLFSFFPVTVTDPFLCGIFWSFFCARNFPLFPKDFWFFFWMPRWCFFPPWSSAISRAFSIPPWPSSPKPLFWTGSPPDLTGDFWPLSFQKTAPHLPDASAGSFRGA